MYFKSYELFIKSSLYTITTISCEKIEELKPANSEGRNHTTNWIMVMMQQLSSNIEHIVKGLRTLIVHCMEVCSLQRIQLSIGTINSHTV